MNSILKATQIYSILLHVLPHPFQNVYVELSIDSLPPTPTRKSEFLIESTIDVKTDDELAFVPYSYILRALPL